MNFIQTITYEELIIIGFSFGTLLYLFELIWIWGGLLMNKPIDKVDYDTSVSIVISARDEEINLKNNLELWLNQNHNSFEVIVINDCSYDNTKHLLAEFERKYQHLRSIELCESKVFKGGKKHALFLGIKGAQFERILFTDTDCKPASKEWLALMNSQFSENKSVVLGAGMYEHKKGLLNYLIQMDTIQIAIQYLGLAARGMPYMGVGRNMAYNKTLFFENSGFKKNSKLQWGDDDLFLNQVARGNNTSICSTPEGFTISSPKTSFYDWFVQKRRHLSTASKYRLISKLSVLIKPLRILLYYSMLIAGILIPEISNHFIIAASMVYLLHVVIFVGLRRKIGNATAFYIFPIVEIALFVINTLIYVSIWIRKPKSWN